MSASIIFFDPKKKLPPPEQESSDQQSSLAVPLAQLSRGAQYYIEWLRQNGVDLGAKNPKLPIRNFQGVPEQ